MIANNPQPIGIIIPSFGNRQYLEPCLASIARETQDACYHILVVNNGAEGSCDYAKSDWCTVAEAEGNRGWEGGLELGLQLMGDPYVLFLNDDTLILPSQCRWLGKLVSAFDDPAVGAVGPTSNVVAGAQSTTWQTTHPRPEVRFLIGFCMLVRRSALDLVGGIDSSLPGGDDIDLSIRLRQAGYTLICDRNVFVYHYGYTTGTRVFGDASQPDGWNSAAMTTRTVEALRKKHGRAIVDSTIAWNVP